MSNGATHPAKSDPIIVDDYPLPGTAKSMLLAGGATSLASGILLGVLAIMAECLVLLHAILGLILLILGVALVAAGLRRYPLGLERSLIRELAQGLEP